MNWWKAAQLQVVPFNLEQEEYNEEPTDYDPYEREEQAQNVFREVKIRPTAPISHVAIENGVVVGSIASKWEREAHPDGDLWIYSFDVALKPEFQKAWGGMKLISEGIANYEREKKQYEWDGGITMMKLWVVNRDLIPILERRYDFSLEADYGPGGAHLVRYN